MPPNGYGQKMHAVARVRDSIFPMVEQMCEHLRISAFQRLASAISCGDQAEEQ